MLHGRRAECDALERLPGPQAAALGGALGLAPRRAWFLDPMVPLFEDLKAGNPDDAAGER